jgi:hypothetical protein
MVAVPDRLREANPTTKQKILILSDAHIGQLSSLLNPPATTDNTLIGSSQARRNYLFRLMLEKLIGEHDIIIFNGDLLDNRGQRYTKKNQKDGKLEGTNQHTMQDALNVLIEMVESHRDKRFIYISGNHDAAIQPEGPIKDEKPKELTVAKDKYNSPFLQNIIDYARTSPNLNYVRSGLLFENAYISHGDMALRARRRRLRVCASDPWVTDKVKHYATTLFRQVFDRKAFRAEMNELAERMVIAEMEKEKTLEGKPATLTPEELAQAKREAEEEVKLWKRVKVNDWPLPEGQIDLPRRGERKLKKRDLDKIDTLIFSHLHIPTEENHKVEVEYRYRKEPKSKTLTVYNTGSLIRESWLEEELGRKNWPVDLSQPSEGDTTTNFETYKKTDGSGEIPRYLKTTKNGKAITQKDGEPLLIAPFNKRSHPLFLSAELNGNRLENIREIRYNRYTDVLRDPPSYQGAAR